MLKGKTVLITGATAGIGKACALKFAESGCNVIITGRRLERLENLEAKIKTDFGVKVYPVLLDVRNRKAVKECIEFLPHDFSHIDILVNNAGLGRGLEPLFVGDEEGWDEMIDTNFKGLLYVSKEVSKIMIKQKSGHIINIGSIAGREVYPNGNVYCATKFAVAAITKALRVELLSEKIRVSTVDPGMVETEFSEVRFYGDKEKAKNVYKGIQPLTPEDIADTVLFVANRPPHVNINEIVIMPTAQASTAHLIRE